MESGNYCVPNNNATNHQDYWESAASPPSKNATDVKELGCYITKEKMKVIGHV